MRASIAIGLLVLVSSAAAADEPSRGAEAQPPMLAAGDALGLALWEGFNEADAQAQAPVQAPSPPAAQAEE